MAIKKPDTETTDTRKRVAMKVDPTRIDSKKLKLGKQTARHDVRTLLLATPDGFNLQQLQADLADLK